MFCYQHFTEKNINEKSQKPEIVSFYNSTKSKVDTLDQLVKYYWVKRKTRRWPMAVFYNLIDIAAFDFYLLYCQKNPAFLNKYKKRARRKFLKLLTDELWLPRSFETNIITFKRPKTYENNLRKWRQIFICLKRLKTSQIENYTIKWFVNFIKKRNKMY